MHVATWGRPEDIMLSVLVCQDDQLKHHTGGLNNRSLFSHSSEALRCKIQWPTGLVSPEASALGL